MENLDKPFWVALGQVPGIGPKYHIQLVTEFGCAQKVWEVDRQTFVRQGFSDKLFQALAETRAKLNPQKVFDEIVQSRINVYTLTDQAYPKLLKTIYDPPPVLYVFGQLSANDEKAIAIVGSRMMTGYGKSVTQLLATGLIDQEFTVVSGLARGIDGVAHQAAIDAGGRTIAILGGGLWHVYPKEHQALASRIAEHGAVISEFPPDIIPLPGHFPARNRIISGLSMAVVVTEATEQSGSLITVASALDQNREVFVVPGPITSAQSKGTNNLIKEGAVPITDVTDILTALNLVEKKVAHAAVTPTGDTEEESMVLQLLHHGYTDTDAIVSRSGLSTAGVLATLSVLELKGWISEVGDNAWILK